MNKRRVGIWLSLVFSLALTPSAHAIESTDPAHPALSFVRINVMDMARMEAFYVKAFGMTVQRRMDNRGDAEEVLTTPGGLDLVLQHLKASPKLILGDAYGELGFYLNDVDGAYKRAVGAGAVSKVAPGGSGGLRVAIVLDPEGHPIELLRRP